MLGFRLEGLRVMIKVLLCLFPLPAWGLGLMAWFKLTLLCTFHAFFARVARGEGGWA